jgi:two-component system NtrC family response regulator
MDSAKLLIVEDDEEIRTQMKWALAQDYEVCLAEDRQSAMEVLKRERPPVMTLDLGLPPHPREVTEGFNLLSEALQLDTLTKVIVITGQTERTHALQAVGQGAYDFLCKPVQLGELKGILNRAFYIAQLEREHRGWQQQANDGSFAGMVGASPQMQEVFAMIRKVAAAEVPVLINGESGTGKELVARAIHQCSGRKTGPLIAINCGAIPENLLESELFGHEKGAFTGAHAQRKGRLETAQGGTLFLDEVGELTPTLQVKLLRFLQEHVIERVGGREEIFLDVRVLAATNKDLQQALAGGGFREDLYYRLAGIVLSLPPLREREGDIVLLANVLLQRYAAESQKKLTGFTQQALRAIERHSWPGNIRELENRLKRAVVVAEGAIVTAAHLQLASSDDRYAGKGLHEAREEVEKEMVQRALVRSKGNLTQAALELGISRPTLYELMGKLGVERNRG